MATVTSIANAIVTQLAALPFVTTASASEYIPAAASVTCAAFVVPFEQETRTEYSSFGDTVLLKHTLTVELWVQVKTSAVGTAMQTARDAAYYTIVKLLDKDGTGYTLARDITFQERIYPNPVTVANVPWIVVQLRVPVENEVTF